MIAYKLSRKEIACKCGCGLAALTWSLLFRWILLRIFVGKSIYVNSGCRCPAHNKAVGGSPKSQHQYGQALDLKTPEGYTVQSFAKVCKLFFPVVITSYKGKNYHWGVHVDVRSDKMDLKGIGITICNIFRLWTEHIILQRNRK